RLALGALRSRALMSDSAAALIFASASVGVAEQTMFPRVSKRTRFKYCGKKSTIAKRESQSPAVAWRIFGRPTIRVRSAFARAFESLRSLANDRAIRSARSCAELWTRLTSDQNTQTSNPRSGKATARTRAINRDRIDWSMDIEL